MLLADDGNNAGFNQITKWMWVSMDSYICKESLKHLFHRWFSTDQRDEYRWGHHTAGVQRQERRQDNERGLTRMLAVRYWKRLLNKSAWMELFCIFVYLSVFFTNKSAEGVYFMVNTVFFLPYLDITAIFSVRFWTWMVLCLLRFSWKLRRWRSEITMWSTNPTCM